MKHRLKCHRVGSAWFELVLFLTIVVLLIQIWSVYGIQILWAIDVRNWPSSVIFSVNILFVLVLALIRFGPDLLIQLRERRQRIANERETTSRVLRLREDRETLERLRESRKRRIY